MTKNFLSLWLRSIPTVLHHFVAAVLLEILTICAVSHYLQTRKGTTSSPQIDKRELVDFYCCPYKLLFIHNVSVNDILLPLLILLVVAAGEGSGFYN